VSMEFAACRCDSNLSLYILLQTGFLQANPPVAPTAGRRGRSGWLDRVSGACMWVLNQLIAVVDCMTERCAGAEPRAA
jgi:hypothetical protein